MPTPTQAQLPTYEIYGIDTTYVYEYVGGRWYETLTTKNQVFYPGCNLSGRASYRSAAPIQDCPPSGLWTTILKVRSTDWYPDGSWRNVEHYTDHCRDGNRIRNNYLEKIPRERQQPARYLINKAMVVGTIEQAFSSGVRRVKEHRTSIKIEDTRTSGGWKNFTVTVKYRVEGSTEVTTVQHSVVLKPGHMRRWTLSVPGGGSWATIDSISIHENRPPDPPPAIVPVPVPVLVPVPAPPTSPRR